jgi:hypothetical protein
MVLSFESFNSFSVQPSHKSSFTDLRLDTATYLNPFCLIISRFFSDAIPASITIVFWPASPSID